MTNDSLLDLLRQNNPAAATEDAADGALFQEIVRGPGDPRLRDQPRRRRRPLQRGAVLVGAMAAATGTAWAVGESPLDLFVSDRNDDGIASSPWDQHVDKRSIRRVAAVQIPGVGPAEFWHADTREGGWCRALRLPDRTWAATGRSAIDEGGSAQGCEPTRARINGAGDRPILAITGFEYAENQVAAVEGGAIWRVYYGRVSDDRAEKVTDRASGTSADVQEGKYFALAIIDKHPGRGKALRLVAEDANGHVLLDERKPERRRPLRRGR